jgi:hypothetical protein
MNGYEVVKGQTHSPHKRGTGEGLSIALHLFPHSNAKFAPPKSKNFSSSRLPSQ